VKILSVNVSPIRIEFLTFGQIRVIDKVPNIDFALYKLQKYHTSVETLDEVKADYQQVLQEQTEGLRP
jgi:hypothetical protein